MKFLIDAQLPRRLVHRLREAGFEAIHTLDLPLGNRTPDTDINDLSIREHYVVVTKDADFVNSFHLQHKPHKLLLVSTGNIGNANWSRSSWPTSRKYQTGSLSLTSLKWTVRE